MKRKFIDRPFEVKATKDDGSFTGYGSVFGELDSYRDIVMKGAFANTLKDHAAKNRHVPMLWQHDTRNPIGIYTSIKEDDYGLLVEGQCNMAVQQGKECHALMAQGALTGLSIGYNAVKDDWDSEGIVRKLIEVKLWEISPVTFPAGDSSRVSAVKTLEDLDSLSDLEDYLREADFSKSEASAFVSRVKAICTRSDSAVGEQAKLQTVLKALKSL